MFKHLYSRFLEADPERLHFAAHSHHLWPDVTRTAQLAYWDDCARLVDRKWERIFGEVIPEAQEWIASWIGTAQPGQVVFAPNTHELVSRLLSCFDARRPLRILTTDSEFHSFERQARRLVELGLAHLQRVPTQPFDSFEDRFCSQLLRSRYDLVFFSSIFFNSGLGPKNLQRLVRKARQSSSAVVVDGYHSFGSVPIDLSGIRDDLFFVAGGYKYVQSGEGVCFMHVPQGTDLVPANTGWFAGFDTLESGADVGFPQDGMRFAGSTFDPSGIYRFNAVMEMFRELGLDQAGITSHVNRLQKYFVSRLDPSGLDKGRLVDSASCRRGSFLAFEMGDAEQAALWMSGLKEKNVVVDARGSRLRFGFGIYQEEADVDELIHRMESLRLSSR